MYQAFIVALTLFAILLLVTRRREGYSSFADWWQSLFQGSGDTVTNTSSNQSLQQNVKRVQPNKTLPSGVGEHVELGEATDVEACRQLAIASNLSNFGFRDSTTGNPNTCFSFNDKVILEKRKKIDYGGHFIGCTDELKSIEDGCGIDGSKLPKGRYVKLQFHDDTHWKYVLTPWEVEVYDHNNNIVSRNKPVTTSGNHNAESMKPEYAVDGNMGTFWHSNHGASTDFIKIDLGREVRILKIRIYNMKFNTTVYNHVTVEARMSTGGPDSSDKGAFVTIHDAEDNVVLTTQDIKDIEEIYEFDMSRGDNGTLVYRGACDGLKDDTLAKDVSVDCLRTLLKYEGCNETGTVWPQDDYNGWWRRSPEGTTTVYCTDEKSGEKCGAGNFATVKSDIHSWATLTDDLHVKGCKGG